MIHWADNLYIGAGLNKKKDKVMTAVNSGKVTFNVYGVTFASQPSDLFDIVNVNEFLIPHNKKSNIKILALALGKDEAITLVQEMIMKVYEETGGFEVRSFFT